MQRVPVNSSNLVSVGYDAPSKTLEIEFKQHRIYQYSQVPQSIHTGLMHAKSHGKYFAANIKNKYHTKPI